MTIKTEHWLKPIPDRNFDWSAVDADTYDGPGCPIGWGPTEAAAIADLIDQLPESEEPLCTETDFCAGTSSS